MTEMYIASPLCLVYHKKQQRLSGVILAIVILAQSWFCPQPGGILYS